MMGLEVQQLFFRVDSWNKLKMSHGTIPVIMSISDGPIKHELQEHPRQYHTFGIGFHITPPLLFSGRRLL
ncbi:hypothetical protein J6590_005405 [Homalodisca vitripennis]|nr:hypothetical protein J6590_005405 [Homalodisca vitripennis]